MTLRDISRLRLASQQISVQMARTPADVVASFGAMQAQDYASALWAIGLRLSSASEAEIEQAVAGREIVRSWPMRGTLHFVAADDLRWMLALMTPRVIAASRRRWEELELSDAIFVKSRKVVEKLLGGGKILAREDLLAGLEGRGISTAGGRAYHILWRLAQERVLCFGPRDGKQKTFVLLDEWIPRSRELSGEAALAELALRYFTSHGPATQADFVWWSGLKVSDAKAGLAEAGTRLANETVDGKVYWMARDLAPVGVSGGFLLPAFDEYLLGYADRGAVLEAKHSPKVVPGSNGVFLPMLVRDGLVVGTWKRSSGRKEVTIQAIPFARLAMAPFAKATKRYGSFLGLAAKFKE
jgi:hypothetical protein